jgi:hypothetical protein
MGYETDQGELSVYAVLAYRGGISARLVAIGSPDLTMGAAA